MRRNQTLTEPLNYSPGHSGQSEVFYNGSRMPRSPTVSLETSFVGIKALAEPYGTEGGSDFEGRGQQRPWPRATVRGSGVAGSVWPATVHPYCLVAARLRAAVIASTQQRPTSGISSMSSSPSREPASSISMDTDCASLNTGQRQNCEMQLSLSPQSNHNHILLSKSNSTRWFLLGRRTRCRAGHSRWSRPPWPPSRAWWTAATCTRARVRWDTPRWNACNSRDPPVSLTQRSTDVSR